MMTEPLLISGILEHAIQNNSKTEIVSKRVEGDIHRYSILDAAKRSKQLANALVNLGVKEGDVLGTMAVNGYRHFELYFGISGIGAVLHTLNPRLFPEQIDFIVNHAEDKYLFIDLPPGTGDIQLSLCQSFSIAGAVIVSTPQEIALQDVKRGIRMFDKLKVKILGLIDNMSHFIGDDGKKYAIFGEGGVKKTADEFKKEFLGEIPINPEVGKTGDEGKPIVEARPEHEISKIYLNFAKKIKSTYL